MFLSETSHCPLRSHENLRPINFTNVTACWLHSLQIRLLINMMQMFNCELFIFNIDFYTITQVPDTLIVIVLPQVTHIGFRDTSNKSLDTSDSSESSLDCSSFNAFSAVGNGETLCNDFPLKRTDKLVKRSSCDFV